MKDTTEIIVRLNKELENECKGYGTLVETQVSESCKKYIFEHNQPKNLKYLIDTPASEQLENIAAMIAKLKKDVDTAYNDINATLQKAKTLENTIEEITAI